MIEIRIRETGKHDENGACIEELIVGAVNQGEGKSLKVRKQVDEIVEADPDKYTVVEEYESGKAVEISGEQWVEVLNKIRAFDAEHSRK